MVLEGKRGGLAQEISNRTVPSWHKNSQQDLQGHSTSTAGSRSRAVWLKVATWAWCICFLQTTKSTLLPQGSFSPCYNKHLKAHQWSQHNTYLETWGWRCWCSLLVFPQWAQYPVYSVLIVSAFGPTLGWEACSAIPSDQEGRSPASPWPPKVSGSRRNQSNNHGCKCRNGGNTSEQGTGEASTSTSMKNKDDKCLVSGFHWDSVPLGQWNELDSSSKTLLVLLWWQVSYSQVGPPVAAQTMLPVTALAEDLSQSCGHLSAVPAATATRACCKDIPQQGWLSIHIWPQITF